MSNPYDLTDIAVINGDGTSSLVPIKYRTVIPQEYNTPVLVIGEDVTRVIIEIRTATREHYQQIFDQILMKISVDVKSLVYNEWNPPPVRGRLIIDY